MVMRTSLREYFQINRNNGHKPQVAKKPDSLEKLRADLRGVENDDERVRIAYGRLHLIPYAGNGLG